MNKLLITIISFILLVSLMTPSITLAESTCTQVYGQGVVCGVKTPEEPHAPVKAGLADFSLKIAGFGLLAISIFSYTQAYKKARV
jgi:hypothetical protein